jgi:outer membrane protein OmpA-like peptidoglycan-associated protein
LLKIVNVENLGNFGLINRAKNFFIHHQRRDFAVQDIKNMILSRCWWLTLSAGLSLPALANVVGPEAQNFNPTTSGIDFVTVQSAEVLEPGVFNLGIFANQAINTLPLFEEPGSQNRTRINDSLLMSDFNVGVGVFPNFELGFSYPRIMYQRVEETHARGQFGTLGNTELRFMAKYHLFKEGAWQGALALSSNINRTMNNPYAGDGAGPTYNLEYAQTLDFLGLKWGANFGYRFKDPGEPLAGSPIQPTDDQWIASFAASYYLEAIDSKLIVETFGSRPATNDKSATDRQRSSAEVLGGVKHFLTDNLALHAGAGSELIHGAFSPDWRAYAGLNWTFSSEVEIEESEKFMQITTTQEGYSVAQEIEASDVSQVPASKGEMTLNFGKIYFELNSSTDVLPGAEKTLANLVQYLKIPPPFSKVIVEGHTDSLGSDSYNLKLSNERARTIRMMLIRDHGIDPAKIEAVGFGESKPIDDNGNFQGRQNNRRVDFRVIR